MSMFYRYKTEPEILAVYEAPSGGFVSFIEAETRKLTTVYWFEYAAHWLINGRGLPIKTRLSIPEAAAAACVKVSTDYRWANEQGWMTEIRVCNHIEKGFGLSIFLCMKQLEADEQGWTMLEQVLIKRPNGECSLWSYSDE